VEFHFLEQVRIAVSQPDELRNVFFNQNTSDEERHPAAKLTGRPEMSVANWIGICRGRASFLEKRLGDYVSLEGIA
jgi:hypothetical protein